MSSLWQIRTGIEICFEVHVEHFLGVSHTQIRYWEIILRYSSKWNKFGLVLHVDKILGNIYQEIIVLKR